MTTTPTTPAQALTDGEWLAALPPRVQAATASLVRDLANLTQDEKQELVPALRGLAHLARNSDNTASQLMARPAASLAWLVNNLRREASNPTTKGARS